MTLSIEHRRWHAPHPPRRVLAIRMQALGDTVITLPYLHSLRRAYPDMRIDFLTRDEVASIPRAVSTFDEVISFGGGRNFWGQLLALTRLLPRLWRRRYEVVLDLQNSRLSRLACAAARPRAWARFEKFAAYAAGERTQATIAAVWDWPVALDTSVRSRDTGVDLLAEHGVHSGTELVVLNPAGNMSSRSWPVANYIEFARLWREQSPGARFVLLLLPAMRAKAGQIAAALGTACIDLTGVADAVQAFGIVGASRCVLSEDSGLMHMAWVQGVPTLALFSSSRADWARPLGPRSHCLHSADLDCGPCGRAVCRFGDNRCLTRYSARHVFELARHLSGS